METVKRKIRYIDIAEKLREWINKKNLKPGSPIMSCRDISQMYNVSVKTARSAIKVLVNEDLLYLEHGRGTFIKEPETTKTKLLIGCAVSAPGSILPLTYNSTASGRQYSKIAIESLTNLNCDVRHIPNIVVHINEELKKYIEGVDGLLISAMDVELAECLDLRKLNIPVVIFESEIEHHLPFSQVVPDHYPAMRELFAKVSPAMFEKLIIVSEPYLNHIARRDAFIDCALEAGFSKEQINTYDVFDGEAYSIGMAISKIDESKLIFTTNGKLASILYKALNDFDKKLCQDYQMVCYGTIEKDQMQNCPTGEITSIDYSHKMASIIAAELLIKEIKKNYPYKQIIKLPTKLSRRSSTLF